MIHRVRMSPTGEEFDCPADKPILVAAMAANILISHGCRSGQCGSCQGWVLEGEIDYPGGFPEAISREEAATGLALFCSAHASSDLTIKLRTAADIFA